MTESRETRLKRLRIRSWRRGTREMDLILGGFADAGQGGLAGLDDTQLDAYEVLLEENDWDLYYWVTGERETPEAHRPIITQLRRHRGMQP